jgi:epoxyqueuosine reductase
MKVKWRWYEIYGLTAGILVFGLLVMFAGTSLAEKETQALLIGLAATLGVGSAGVVMTVAKRRGKLEHPQAQRVLVWSLGVLTAFVVVLFIPTSGETQAPRKCGTCQIPGDHKATDARKQAGGALLSKLSTTVKNDVLTLTIYDICIGKVSHKVNRDGPVSDQQVTVTDVTVLTRKIKEEVKTIGADVVGITELRPEYVFTHDLEGNPISLPHKYAIVIGVGLDHNLAGPSAPLPYEKYYSSLPEDLAAALSGVTVKTDREVPKEVVEEVQETMKFFSEGGSTAVQLAAYIRSLGYPARAHFHRWGEVQIIPLAIEAGLGELGKNGMLIGPTIGPRGSFAVVTTDLPLVTDQPVDIGIQEFCEACSKCARSCPVQAVPWGDPQVINGVMKWPLDGEKCFQYLVSHPKCLSCIGTCPYNKQKFLIHDIAEFMIARKSVVTNTLLTWLDDFLGYGKSALPVNTDAKG